MKNMIIPFNQKHFGLCFRKKSLQNYERFGSQPHYPAPVKFALAHCIMPLKTYFNEKFHFGDFDFLAFLSGYAYLRLLGALPILSKISKQNNFWASLTILHMCPNVLFDQIFFSN